METTQNKTLKLLKREFPEIKGTSNAFDWAASHEHNETLKLLKREFPEIKKRQTRLFWWC